MAVHPQTIVIPSFRLECGVTLTSVSVAYEMYGEINGSASNVILVEHAFTGDAHAAGIGDSDGKPGWWDSMIGPGKAFDTNRYAVICSNVLAGCRGTTGPSSINPDTGEPYAMSFPATTIGDMVRLQAELMDRLGVERLLAVSGGSMGGMQVLEWAVRFPERVCSAIPIASTGRHSAQQIAFNEVGRQAIMSDPDWNEGNYYEGDSPKRGLAVARMVGHITYMSDHSLEAKFGRRLQDFDAIPYTLDEPEFAIESYLGYQGEKFVGRFDANSYLYITKALDYFNIADGFDSMEAALAHTEASFLVVSFSSDWLYTEAQARELSDALCTAGRPTEEHRVQAVYGHDSFLVEVETMTTIVGGYLARQWETEIAERGFAEIAS